MKMGRCYNCRYWVFTETLRSQDKPEWHCRDGFSPSKDCKDMAAYNDECTKAYYKKYPNELQLKLRFR